MVPGRWHPIRVASDWREDVSTVDRQEAQRFGASHNGGYIRPLNEGESLESKLMYIHGWRTGHAACACPVAGEYGREVNGTHVDMTAA